MARAPMSRRGVEALGLAALVGLAASSCQHADAHAPAAAVRTADPAAAPQLTSGFHEIEQGAWRWTAGRFTALLGAPARASIRGATLRLALYVPEPIARQGGTTLSCSVDRIPLPPEPYARAGSYELVRDVEPIAGPAATLECTLSRPLAPNAVDHRELGVVISSLTLEPK
jgi:hypothetical protein